LSLQEQQRELLLEFRDRALALGLNIFAVVEPEGSSGASIFAARHSPLGAAHHARKQHIQWELDHGIDPTHDWSQR